LLRSAKVAELGNILEDGGDGPRGPDLHVELQVPRAALGAERGWHAQVPLKLPHAGERVSRSPSPLDEADRILLRIPEGFPSGGVLKLRGQGGAIDKGNPGDLLAKIIVVDGVPAIDGSRALASSTLRRWPWIALLLAAATIIAWAL
jgi:hypothetical protein